MVPSPNASRQSSQGTTRVDGVLSLQPDVGSNPTSSTSNALLYVERFFYSCMYSLDVHAFKHSISRRQCAKSAILMCLTELPTYVSQILGNLKCKQNCLFLINAILTPLLSFFFILLTTLFKTYNLLTHNHKAWTRLEKLWC